MRPPLACQNCRARKKKCDRAYPKCSHCLRAHDRCQYRGLGRLAQPASRAVPLEQFHCTDNSPVTNVQTAAAFLGYPYIQGNIPQGFVSRVLISKDLQEFVADANNDDYLAQFLQTVNYWMPVIPVQYMQSNLSQQLNLMTNEETLLLACIKLLTHYHPGDHQSSRYYLAVKTSIVAFEVNGQLSIHLLQAQILVLIYEYGHAIYPSAYLTLGFCSRYLTALGIHGPKLPEASADWIDLETQRRLWWSIYVIERTMAISRPCEPLLLAEPDENDPLPSDDTSWLRQENSRGTKSCKDWVMPMEKQERQTSLQLTLLSPVTSRMGSFQLLVHAAYLLSKAIQCASESQQGLQIHDERYVQLIRTVEALMTVLEIERQSAIVAVGMPRNILNSTIFVIYSLLREAKNPLVAQLERPRELSAAFYLERTRNSLEGNLGDVRIAPPFILQWGFRVIQFYSDKYKLEGHDDFLKAIQDIERFFAIFDQRWKIAGIYMSLLKDIL